MCYGTSDTFLNFVETSSFLALRRDLLPPGPGWRSSGRTACNLTSVIGHAEKQTSTPLALLNLDCLLSGLWQRKRFWIHFVLPFYVAQRKTKAKTTLWNYLLYEKINRPLCSERLQPGSRISVQLLRSPGHWERLPCRSGMAPETSARASSLHFSIPFTEFHSWRFPFF